MEKLIERSASKLRGNRDGYSAGDRYREDYGRNERGHYGRSSSSGHGDRRSEGGYEGNDRQRRSGFLEDLFDF